MAELDNDTYTLRLQLALADRELVPGATDKTPAEAFRVLGTAAVEFFDRRDKEFWPFLRLPSLYLAGEDAPALIEALRDLCAMKRDSFLLRTGDRGELAVGVARGGGGFDVEVGVDLAPILAQVSGTPGEPGHQLAMFRFTTGTAQVVVFADQLKQELERLPRPAGGAP